MGAFPLISIFSLQLRLNQLFFLKIIFKMKLAVSLFVVSFLALVTTTQTENSDSDGDPVLESDPCSAPMDAGPCKESKASYYFDKRSMSCKICMYVDCGGNGNNFRKKSECLRAYKPQIVETVKEAEKAVEVEAVKKVEEAVEGEVEEAVKEEAVQEEADEEMAEEMAEEEKVEDKPAK